MADFLVHAIIAGIAITTIAGPLGSFVVWQRLAYFGDTLAHSALLGIAISLGFAINTQLTIIICCLGLAVLLTVLQRKPELASDSLLGILSHGSLATGLVAVSLMDNVRFDLNAYLFGDLLAIGIIDLAWVITATIGLSVLLIWQWRSLLTVTVHAELAQVEGYPVERLRLLLMLMIALLVAVSMKIIGILLITALLIIPAASARYISKTPEQMAIFASIIGWISVLGGLGASYVWDTPAGPSIVVFSTLLFCLSRVVTK